MVKSVKFVLLILFLIIPSTSLNSQEKQITWDSDGRYDIIDNEIREQLDIFPEYKKFQKALLFEVSDTLYVMEIFYQDNNNLYKDRKVISPDSLSALRNTIDSRMRGYKVIREDKKDYRVKLLTGTTMLSLGYYGWALPVALDVDDYRTGVGLYMVTAASGFFLPFWITENTNVSGGQAELGIYGGTRGIFHGILLNLLFSGEQTSDRGIIGTGMAVSLLEGAAFYSIADGLDINAGKAETIGVLGDFGAGIGMGLSSFSGDTLSGINARRLVTSLGLIGSTAGLITGNIISNMENYTPGDARVLRMMGAIGGYVPLAAVSATNTNSWKTFTRASIGGGVLGLTAGHLLLRDRDFDPGSGNLISLSTVAGALFGAGISYLTSDEYSEEDRTVYLSLTSAGAVSGFLLSYQLFKESAVRIGGDNSINIQVRPENLLGLTLKDNEIDYPISSNLVEINYRF